MKKQKNKLHIQKTTPQEPAKLPFSDYIPAVVLALTLVLAPILPDVQITRPKLMVIELGIFTAILVFIIKILNSGTIRIRLNPLNVPILMYIIYIFTCYMFSDNKSVAFNEFKRMLLCSSIFFLSANIISPDESLCRKQRNLVLAGLLIGSSIAVIYGIMQHFGNIRFFGVVFSVPQMGRCASTFGNPIFFAAHLIIFIPIVSGLLLNSFRKDLKSSFSFNSYRFFLIIIIFSALIALYYTQTRAAWIAFAFSAVLFGIINIKSKKLKLTFLIIAGISIAGFTLLTWQVWLRHQAHPLIWKDTLRLWLSSPLFGTGPGTFHINFPAFASPELLKIWPQSQQIINDAHNEYVQILAETGIIGFAIFFAIIFFFFKYGFDVYKQKPRNKYMLSGLLCSAAAILAQNVFSVDMRFIISAFHLFLVIGLLCSFGNTFSLIIFN